MGREGWAGAEKERGVMRGIDVIMLLLLLLLLLLLSYIVISTRRRSRTGKDGQGQKQKGSIERNRCYHIIAAAVIVVAAAELHRCFYPAMSSTPRLQADRQTETKDNRNRFHHVGRAAVLTPLGSNTEKNAVSFLENSSINQLPFRRKRGQTSVVDFILEKYSTRPLPRMLRTTLRTTNNSLPWRHFAAAHPLHPAPQNEENKTRQGGQREQTRQNNNTTKNDGKNTTAATKRGRHTS